MARVNTYLNFMGKTEEAFNFYKEVFSTEITSLTRMKDMPRPEGAPSLAESEANLIMNIQMPITNGHVLMATDMIASMGHNLKVGNNVTISLDLDSQEEAERFITSYLPIHRRILAHLHQCRGELFGDHAKTNMAFVG